DNSGSRKRSWRRGSSGSGLRPCSIITASTSWYAASTSASGDKVVEVVAGSAVVVVVSLASDESSPPHDARARVARTGATARQQRLVSILVPPVPQPTRHATSRRQHAAHDSAVAPSDRSHRYVMRNDDVTSMRSRGAPSRIGSISRGRT